MSEKEICGNYEIFKNEEDWWVVKNINSGNIIGRFQKKEDALEKIALFLKNEEEREESESVC